MTALCALYSISPWLFRDLGSSEIPYLAWVLNFPFFSSSCPSLHLAPFLVCAQTPSLLSPTSHHPTLLWTITAKLGKNSPHSVPTSLPSHPPLVFLLTIRAVLPRLLWRLFFQEFISPASYHTSQWIIFSGPKRLCLFTDSHLCLERLSPPFTSLYSYSSLQGSGQPSASVQPLPKPPEVWFPFHFLVSPSASLCSSKHITCDANLTTTTTLRQVLLLSHVYRWQNKPRCSK